MSIMRITNKIKAKNENKLEQAIAKALYDLKLYTSLYVGERQIERGEGIPHEEVFKRLRKIIKFKLTRWQKEKIKQDIRDRIHKFFYTHKNDAGYPIEIQSLWKYVFDLIENREEAFKKPKKTDLAIKRLGLNPHAMSPLRHDTIEGPCECGAWH